MANILNLILNKLGKSSPEELSPAGKETFYRYQKFLELSQKGITIPMFYEFKKSSKEQIIAALVNPEIKLNSDQFKYLQAELSICLIDLAMLESPAKATEMLEKQLKEKHNIK